MSVVGTRGKHFRAMKLKTESILLSIFCSNEQVLETLLDPSRMRISELGCDYCAKKNLGRFHM